MLTLIWISFLFVALAWLWPIYWRRLMDGKVDCVMSLQKSECAIGESVPFTLTLVNRSRLPIPFAQVSINLPPELSLQADAENRSFTCSTYVLMRRRVKTTLTLYGRRRGPCVIHDVSVSMHEGFGMRTLHLWNIPSVGIAVRPGRNPASGIITITTVDGQRPIERWIFPDETIFKGVRPYQAGDVSRHIDWRASAKLGQLVTKQFFSSTEDTVLLILNAQTSGMFWAGGAREPFDMACESLAYMARDLERKKAQMTFATNAVISGNRHNVVFQSATRADIDSMLAHSLPMAAASLSALLGHIRHRLSAMPPNIILFSEFETAEQSNMLAILQKKGKRIDIVRPNIPSTASNAGSAAQ